MVAAVGPIIARSLAIVWALAAGFVLARAEAAAESVMCGAARAGDAALEWHDAVCQADAHYRDA